MFWGLTLEQGKCYSQVVKESFHITMAALDPQSDHGASTVSVLVNVCDGGNFVTCTLQQGHWQQPLDLVFVQGEVVTLASRGRGVVHLTGYLLGDEGKSILDTGKQWESSSQVSTANGVKRPSRSTKVPSLPAKKQKIETLDSLDADGSDEDNADDNADDYVEEVEEEEEEEGSDEEEEQEEDVESPVAKKTQKADVTSEKAKADKTPKAKAPQAAKEAAPTLKTPQQQKQQFPSPKAKPAAAQPQTRSTTPGPKMTLPGGLLSQDVTIGTGIRAKRGKMVTVYYKGMLTSGKEFDSTTSGKGFTFRLGAGEVIKGWDMGIEGMSVGGKRKLSIPAHLAYGSKRMGPIPPNSTLNFSVELKRVS
uniref:FK506-binding protein n=1 Tax=Petromyzon marinus TaxID=7757 RepID=A0AAJ7TXR9_PETMA|nr:46 kDa FK506-binding nuclear protein-like [Petromyzon marinus]